MKAKRSLVFVCLFAVILLIGLTVFPGCHTAEHKCGMAGMATTAGPSAETAGSVEQTTCPVMGGKINRNIYTQYKGQRVFFAVPAVKRNS